MKPVVDRLQQEYRGRIDFNVRADLNADSEGDVQAREHGASAVPTMMLVAPDGLEVERWVGGVSSEELRSAFEESLR